MANVFMYTDVHWGLHPVNSEKWLPITTQFYESFLFPLLEDQYQEGDIIINLGDTFDNRSYLEINVINEALRVHDLMDRANYQQYFIVGNHDMWNEISRKNNSVNIFRRYDSINIIEEATEIEIAGKKLGLLPFCSSDIEQQEMMRKLENCDYLFAHCDVYGAKLHGKKVSSATKLQHGLKLDSYSKWDKVFSGHIHIKQKMQNFYYLGCPYHQSRSDIGDAKGVWKLNLETEELAFFENHVSPRFRVVDVQNTTIEEIEKALAKDFIDLEVNESTLLEYPELREKIEQLAKDYSFERIIKNNDLFNGEDIEEINLNENYDLIEMVTNIIEDTDLNTANKKLAITLVSQIFKIFESSV